MASSATSRQSRSASRKVCLFSYVHYTRPSRKLRGLYLDVYVFDLDREDNLDLHRNPTTLLDGKSLISVSPALRLRLDNDLVPCVVNSRLYLFTGVSSDPNPEGKSVYIHDLSSSPSPAAMSLRNLKSCPPMLGEKLMPYAIPTPDCRKIVVFSTLIEVDPRPEGLVDFELYDHVNGTSRELPSLPDVLELSGRPKYYITAYYFIDDTTFAVRTDSYYSRMEFTLDLNEDRNPSEWRVIRDDNDNDIPRVMGEGYRVGGSCIISRFGLYDMSRKYICSDFPHDPDVKVDSSEMFFLPAPLDNGPDGEPEMCICYVDFDCIDRPKPRVFINTHQINPATIYQEDSDSDSGGRGGYGGGRGRGRGTGRGGWVSRRLAKTQTRSRGRGDKVGYYELTPAGSRGYGFELSMSYQDFSPNSLYLDIATAE